MSRISRKRSLMVGPLAVLFFTTGCSESFTAPEAALVEYAPQAIIAAERAPTAAEMARAAAPSTAPAGTVLHLQSLSTSVLEERFDNPLSGWTTRFMGLHSNLRNVYQSCSPTFNQDFRGNNADGLWIHDGNCTDRSSYIRFDPAFGATITNISLDVGSHDHSARIVIYDGDLNVLLDQAVPPGCSNCGLSNRYATFSVASSNGVAGFDLVGNFIEGNVGIDNIVLNAGPPVPQDGTPPEIQSSVSGTLGANGWYVSDVSVAWTVTDAESPDDIVRTGCEPLNVTTDTPGATSSCAATSPGGTSGPETVSVKRDATAPVVAFAGATSYDVDENVQVTCSATDATSGIASSTCPDASGPAYSFDSSTSLSASATDNAGHSASASVTFSVQATHAGLCGVVRAVSTSTDVADGLCDKLAAMASARNAKSLAGKRGAFVNQLRAQTGKAISEADAAMLLDWLDTL